MRSRSCDFPARVFLNRKSKMTSDCWVFKFLRRIVNGKHLVFGVNYFRLNLKHDLPYVKCLWNEMKKLPKIILWYWWLCFDCKFFHRTFTLLLRPSQRHMIMGDISSRGHFDLMTSQGLQVSRQCKNKQWKRAPVKRGNYCVARSRENVSCTNTIYSPGISMHRFQSLRQRIVVSSFIVSSCSLTR